MYISPWLWFSTSVRPAGSRLASCQGRPRPRCPGGTPRPTGQAVTVRHHPGGIVLLRPVSMTSENVLANWPAEMPHSRYGECDFDPERVNETSGSEQPAGRADCVGSGGRVDGSKSAPHQAHPGGLPGERRGGPGPRAPRKQTGQRHTCGSDRRRSALGQHPIRRSQPHPSLRVTG